MTTDACPIQLTSDGHAHPYVRVTSRQKHLRHGGHNVNYTTRPGMDDPDDDSIRSQYVEKIQDLKKEKKLLEAEIAVSAARRHLVPSRLVIAPHHASSLTRSRVPWLRPFWVPWLPWLNPCTGGGTLRTLPPPRLANSS